MDDEMPEEESENPTVKLPEAFQQKVQALVDGLKTEAELNFVCDLCDEQRKAITSSQKKSGLATDKFSTEDMPQG